MEITESPKKILFIRLDKIGDLVCTLPCDEHPLLNSAEKTWIINKGNEFIIKNALPARNFIAIDKKKPWRGFRRLLKFSKENSFDVAFSFQSPWWVNMALFFSGIPFRFGVLSQWHSFLFLNHGLRQKRSQALKHEADYNYEIIQQGLLRLGLATAVETSATVNSTTNSAPTTATPFLKLRAPADDELLKKFEKSNFLVRFFI